MGVGSSCYHDEENQHRILGCCFRAFFSFAGLLLRILIGLWVTIDEGPNSLNPNPDFSDVIGCGALGVIILP